MLTLTQSSLVSISENNDTLNVVSQNADNILSGGVNSMSEHKQLAFTLDWAPDEYAVDSISDLWGANIFINFSNWLPPSAVWIEGGGPPNSGFNTIVHNDMLPYTGLMSWYSTSALNPLANKNYKCQLSFVGGNQLTFTLDFYNGFDEYGYLSSSSKNNQWRFLSERWDNQSFNTVTDSYYATPKQIRAMLYIQKGGYTEKKEITIYQGQANSYDTQMLLTYNDDTAVVALSTINDSSLKARVEIPTNDVNVFYAKLIKIQNDPTLDFINNYALQENLIDASNMLANGFKGPFTVAFNVDHYDLEFVVDKDFLELGKNYRVIIIGYNQGTGDPDYTGAINYLAISHEFTTTSAIPYCVVGCSEGGLGEENYLHFTGSLIDVNNEYTGNELDCIIEERLRSKLVVDHSGNAWVNNLRCRNPSAAEFANDLRNYLSNVSCEIYTEYTDTALGGVVKNQLEYWLMQRNSSSVSLTSYVSNGIAFNFDLTNKLLTLSADFRCRDEAATPCNSTTLNGANFFPVQDNQYWGGKDVFIKWSLYFYYHDFPMPFIDRLDFVQKLHVADYGYDDIAISAIGDKSFVCGGETVCFNADINSGLADPETYNLINTIEPVDSGGIAAGGLKESESYDPPELDQQQDEAFFDQDDAYSSGGQGLFCLDPANLIINQEYKISVMAKKQ
jgi:hypothetical protein